MHPIALSILGLSALLTAVSIVVPMARRARLPYTLVLASLGVVIGLLGYLRVDNDGFGSVLISGLRELGLLDDAFIDVYLPPLLFAAGLTVDVRHIFEDIWHVMALALVAVFGCTLFVGYGLYFASGMALLPCLLLGTIVSTTDTAAVVAIFQDVGAPKRLSTIVEGEALFNDAAAIALFGLFLSMLVTGQSLDVAAAGRGFLIALLGGAAFGYVVARAGCWLISVLSDTVTTEVTLTVALTYFTFIVGNELLGVSGVVATVTLAMVIGSVGRTRVSPGSWEVLRKIWEHLDFWATSLIFVTGAMFVPRALTAFDRHDFVNVAVVFFAALVSRGFVIWGMMPAFSAIGASKPMSQSYRGVLWWGGMRGAVTVALALATASSPGVSDPVRHFILATAIGYVIASLTINGLTLQPIMAMLDLEKFEAHDLALRQRVLTLARRRIKNNLREFAAAIGEDATALSRSIVPAGGDTPHPLSPEEQLVVAIETWCHHERDLALSFRERGLLSRHHADVFRIQADRLYHVVSTGDVAAYEREAQHLLAAPWTLRLSFWLFRHARLRTPLALAIGDRMERSIGAMLIMRDLVSQCDRGAGRLFGWQVAADLRQLLEARLDAVEAEITAIKDAYPEFARLMHARHLAVVAIGLMEAEYRRHLTQATISADVFDDLESQRRDIAKAFASRPRLDFRFNVRRAITRFPILAELKPRKDALGFRSAFSLRSRIRPYLTYPGERLSLRRRHRNSMFFIVSGRIEARARGRTVTLGPGKVFGKRAAIDECITVTRAVSIGYVNILEVTTWPAITAAEPLPIDSDAHIAEPATA